jgi:single-stranded DNA-binding protein
MTSWVGSWSGCCQAVHQSCSSARVVAGLESAAEHLADSLAKGDRVMVTGRLRQRSWETPEGDKRSVTEIEADEVGASLKFATAKVERATERGTSDRSQARERQAERGGDFNDQPPF